MLEISGVPIARSFCLLQLTLLRERLVVISALRVWQPPFELFA